MVEKSMRRPGIPGAKSHRGRVGLILAARLALSCLAVSVASGEVAAGASARTGQPTSRLGDDQQLGLNGVNYFGPDFMAGLRRAGVLFGRDELGWRSTTLRQDTATFDAYTSVGMSAQPLLNFPDRIHLGALPTHAFARWAVRRMRTFGPGGSYWSGRSDVVEPAQWEVVNEPYYKHPGSHPQPQAYARIYLAVYRQAKAAGLTLDSGGAIRLGFSTIGDYQRRDGSWSQVDSGGGWFNDALAAQPGLLSAINATGAIVIHPYGAMWARDNEHWDDWNDGWGRIDLYHTMAVDAGVSAPEWVTEAGYQVGCSDSTTCVPDEATQRRDVDQMVDDVQARPFISIFDYFDSVDYSGWQGGLFDINGVARPSWRTFHRDITR